MSWLFFFLCCCSWLYVFIVRVVNFEVLCIRARIILALNYFRHFSDMIFFLFLSCNSVYLLSLSFIATFFNVYFYALGWFLFTYIFCATKKEICPNVCLHIWYILMCLIPKVILKLKNTVNLTHKSNEEPIRIVCLYFMAHFHAKHKKSGKNWAMLKITTLQKMWRKRKREREKSGCWIFRRWAISVDIVLIRYTRDVWWFDCGFSLSFSSAVFEHNCSIVMTVREGRRKCATSRLQYAFLTLITASAHNK